mgnify:CR=1 FL=1
MSKPLLLQALKCMGTWARKRVREGAAKAWKALGDEERAEWKAEEERRVREYEAAKAGEGAALPPTSYKVKLRDSAAAQSLLRLPEEGFCAFRYVGVNGEQEQLGSVRGLAFDYDVAAQQLTVKQCTVGF